MADVFAIICALSEKYSICIPTVSLGLWNGEFLKTWGNRKH